MIPSPQQFHAMYSYGVGSVVYNNIRHKLEQEASYPDCAYLFPEESNA